MIKKVLYKTSFIKFNTHVYNRLNVYFHFRYVFICHAFEIAKEVIQVMYDLFFLTIRLSKYLSDMNISSFLFLA